MFNFHVLNSSSKHLAAMSLLATLVACSGGGGGDKVELANSVLSPDQQIFQGAGVSGGLYGIAFYLPYGGGTLTSGSNYIFSTTTGVMKQSPLLGGPQILTPVQTSLDANLAIPQFGPNRFLVNGQVYTNSATANRKVSYVGTSVQIDHFADDGKTIVQSDLYKNFSKIALTGYLNNTPAELQSLLPFALWTSGNNLSATAKWQPGSYYIKRFGTLLSDTYYAVDCNNNPNNLVQTSGTTPNPCATSGTLQQIFPVAQWGDDGKPYEAEQFSDGTVSTVQGLSMWIANNPLPATFLYRTYYQLGGSIYTGYLIKNGTQIQSSMNDGTVTNYVLDLNQTAVNSIQQSIITGTAAAGSQAGTPTTGSYVDMFGIGGHGVNGSMAPADLISHYNVPSNLTGAGQTIVIVDAPSSGDIADDLNTYSQRYNLPQCNTANPCFQHIDLSNGAAVNPLYDFGAEVELDTQMVHALAPNATIILVTAASSSFNDLFNAIQYAAGLPNVTAISMSFGGSDAQPIVSSTEVDPTAYQGVDALFASIQASGIVSFASSGDSANYAYVAPGGFFYPASSPYVTAVGGTSIKSVSWSQGAQSEIGWQFSGGGIAIGFGLPSWQASYPGISTLNPWRAVPDVSAVADPQQSALSIYFEQQWLMSGGTSASSPIWAGIAALLGEHMANEGKSLSKAVSSTIGGFNGMMYNANITGGANPGLTDIISGNNNISPNTCNVCSVGVGYDDVTGLGVPNVTNLVSKF